MDSSNRECAASICACTRSCVSALVSPHPQRTEPLGYKVRGGGSFEATTTTTYVHHDLADKPLQSPSQSDSLGVTTTGVSTLGFPMCNKRTVQRLSINPPIPTVFTETIKSHSDCLPSPTVLSAEKHLRETSSLLPQTRISTTTTTKHPVVTHHRVPYEGDGYSSYLHRHSVGDVTSLGVTYASRHVRIGLVGGCKRKVGLLMSFCRVVRCLEYVRKWCFDNAFHPFSVFPITCSF